MPRIIATIQGHDITEQDDLTVTYTAKADIDSDGSGPPHGDHTHQDDTSLHDNHGVPLNADFVPYVVVPPAIIKGVAGIVLGCQAQVSFHGKSVAAVVGDVGPHEKLGEISIACAQALGIPSSPVSGGVSGGVDYVLQPGVPATVNGITYTLKPSP